MGDKVGVGHDPASRGHVAFCFSSDDVLPDRDSSEVLLAYEA